MYTWIQSGALSEVNMDRGIAFLFQDSALFDPTGYKFLQGQADGRFLPCMKLLYNGKIKLYYLSAEYPSLFSLLRALSPNAFLRILSSLLGAILEVRGNGYLSCRNLAVSFDKIFVDVNTYTAHMIYLPLSVSASGTGSLSFENDLRTFLLQVIRTTPTLNDPGVRRVAEELQNGMTSFAQLHALISRETAGQAGRPAGHEVRLPMTLLSMGTDRPVEFIIDKDEFLIGSAEGKVDGCIPFAGAVSSVHAKIVYGEGTYSLVDVGKDNLGSTNGTYINNKRLTPGRIFPIQKNDILKFANVEFTIHF